MRKACHLDNDLFTSFFADRCSITADKFDCLMDGISQLRCITSIVLRNSEVSSKSVAMFSPFFLRYIPYNLSEIRFEHCQIATESIVLLLDSMKERNYIKRLAFVGLAFDRRCAKSLTEVITLANYLEDLDLSQLKAQPCDLELILEVMAEKQALKLLNLSSIKFLQESQEPSSHGMYVHVDKQNKCFVSDGTMPMLDPVSAKIGGQD